MDSLSQTPLLTRYIAHSLSMSSSTNATVKTRSAMQKREYLARLGSGSPERPSSSSHSSSTSKTSAMLISPEGSGVSEPSSQAASRSGATPSSCAVCAPSMPYFSRRETSFSARVMCRTSFCHQYTTCGWSCKD